MKKDQLIESLAAKKCLKVIAGISNFHKENVLQIAQAAESQRDSGVCIDICAQEDIITEVLAQYPKLAVFVSSVVTAELKRAQELGADVLELGNYEALHKQGIFYSAQEILDLSKEIMAFRSTALVSITVPGHLNIAEQVKLASELDELGVDIIQTEGASLVEAGEQSSGALAQIEKVRLTLANTIELAKTVENAYLLTASGITPDTAALAIAAGASGVGVGKYVNKLSSTLEMSAAIMALKESLVKNTAKELATL